MLLNYTCVSNAGCGGPAMAFAADNALAFFLVMLGMYFVVKAVALLVNDILPKLGAARERYEEQQQNKQQPPTDDTPSEDAPRV